MTMVPAHQNLSKQQHLVYNNNNNKKVVYSGGLGVYYYSSSDECFGVMSGIELQGHDYYCTTAISQYSNCLLGSDPPVLMAEDDQSRTNSLNEAGSSSKDYEIRDEGWLQLGIGSGGHENNNKNLLHRQTPSTPMTDMDIQRRSSGLVELDLLPAGGGSASSRQLGSSLMFHHHVPEIIPTTTLTGGPSRSSPSSSSTRPFPNFTNTSLYFQHPHPGSCSSNFPSLSHPHPHPHHQQQHQYHQQQQDQVNWAFRPVSHNIIATASTSSSSSALMPLGGSSSSSYSSYFARQFQLQSRMDHVAAAGPTVDFRVVNPPRRPHSGIWFMLQASQNQAKEPFLPQIPKNYLRIKDGGMTVRLLIKYLVNKLRLDSEAEVEITCRGQQLLPFLTLQHVRDNIWSPRDALSLLPDSSTSTSDHVMVLQYARSTSA